jgi:hypothetical protein
MATTPIQTPLMNPTGTIGSGFFNTPGLGTGGPGNMNFGNAMNANPAGTAPPKATPAVTANPGGSPSGGPTATTSPTGTVTSEGTTTASANPYGLSQSQNNWMQKYLQETYGGGMGALIYQYLQSNGGYNGAVAQQSIDSQVNAMGQQTQLGANNLASMLGASGVSASSSGYGATLGNYENQAVAQQNALTSQEYYNMWNQSQQNQENMIQFAATGTGKTLANKPNWMDYLNEGLGVLDSMATVAA